MTEVKPLYQCSKCGTTSAGRLITGAYKWIFCAKCQVILADL